MIRRSVLEWKKMPYGEGQEDIPEWAADRIARVAKASPLGGKDGARILQHGRTSIRAQQVVGIIAAEGCTLEILPKIDGLGDGKSVSSQAAIRRNLVHMLAVALDLDIAAGSITDLGWQHDNLLEVLIRLFCDRLFDAVHRGMTRRYIECTDDVPALRGRLDVVRQFTTLAASPQLLACRYDALSSDIALNQIMKAAVSKLLPLSRAPDNQRKLRELSFVFVDLSTIAVRALPWDQVVLDRTNARWRELLALARLLLGDRFQTTTSGQGRGFSLLFEMNTLFEEYVGRMLRRALAGTRMRVALQGGRLYCLTELDIETDQQGNQRFMTKPDIIVRCDSRTVMIIDTKWKRLASSIDDRKQGISQADIYQMMAYGRLYDCPQLMLLYPHHDDLHRPAGVTSRHLINGSDDTLVTATIGLSDLKMTKSQLANLARPFVQDLELNAINSGTVV
jgi:5-methylcytosine-specific restriction enzyme subunit McrC